MSRHKASTEEQGRWNDCCLKSRTERLRSAPKRKKKYMNTYEKKKKTLQVSRASQKSDVDVTSESLLTSVYFTYNKVNKWSWSGGKQ